MVKQDTLEVILGPPPPPFESVQKEWALWRVLLVLTKQENQRAAEQQRYWRHWTSDLAWREDLLESTASKVPVWVRSLRQYAEVCLACVSFCFLFFPTNEIKLAKQIDFRLDSPRSDNAHCENHHSKDRHPTWSGRIEVELECIEFEMRFSKSLW